VTLEPYDLSTESRATPIGVDAARPILAWKLRSAEPHAGGEQHRVRVYRDGGAEGGDLLWDSGWLEFAPEQPTAVAYGGAPLESLTRYHWDVAVRGGDPSTSVIGTWFETGILHADEWQAAWIRRDISHDPGRVPPSLDDGLTDRTRMLQAPARFRRAFEVSAELTRARAWCTPPGG